MIAKDTHAVDEKSAFGKQRRYEKVQHSQQYSQPNFRQSHLKSNSQNRWNYQRVYFIEM